MRYRGGIIDQWPGRFNVTQPQPVNDTELEDEDDSLDPESDESSFASDESSDEFSDDSRYAAAAARSFDDDAKSDAAMDDLAIEADYEPIKVQTDASMSEREYDDDYATPTRRTHRPRPRRLVSMVNKAKRQADEQTEWRLYQMKEKLQQIQSEFEALKRQQQEQGAFNDYLEG